ncbi:MAG: hypothetical protein U0414_26605 [Polyangiaceae bacterium]
MKHACRAPAAIAMAPLPVIMARRSARLVHLKFVFPRIQHATSSPATNVAEPVTRGGALARSGGP